MRTPNNKYKKLVLVCTNSKTSGECCKAKGSGKLFQELSFRIKMKYPGVRISQTGCLGNCFSGANVVIMPDNVWLGEVTTTDIPEIVELVGKGL